jgi:CubicO group peptidase (beta-lactamase class C family)
VADSGGALALTAAWPVAAPAVGVTEAARVLASTGPIDEPVPWASVTKLLTALAALVALEEGIIDLGEPAGPPGATLRHLLAHASGLSLEGDGRPAQPGTRRIYSNAGIELVAERVAERAGMPFRQYLIEGVLVPLEMKKTRLGGSPAWSALGPLCDLLALGRELLAPTLISEASLGRATTVVFPDLSGVLPGYGRQEPNDWGLGFELRDHKSPHWTGRRNSPATFGHFGQTGSFLWVDPVARLACGCLTGHDFGPWAVEAWPRLSDAVLSEFATPA